MNFTQRPYFITLFLFFILFSKCSFADEFDKRTIDSLRLQLKTASNDTIKLKAMASLAFAIKYSHKQESDSLCQGAIKLGVRLKKFDLVAESYKTLGILSDENKLYQQSIDYYLKAVNYFKLANNEIGVAKTEANIGLLMQRIDQKAEALKYFKSALQTFSALKVYPAMIKAYQCVGGVYFDFKKADSSLHYFLLAEKIVAQLGLKDPGLYTNLSNAYSLKRDYKKQNEYLNKSIQMLKEINDTTYKYYLCIYNLGYSEIHNKNIDKGLALISRGISGLERHDQVDNEKGVHMYYRSSEAFFAFGKLKEAYLYLKRAFRVADTMHKTINYKQINALKAQYEDEKKELTISALNKEKTLSEAQLKTEGKIKLALAVLLVLTLGILILTYRNFKQKKRDNQIIQQQKEQVEEKNKEITDSINYAKKIQKVILPSDERWRAVFPESFVVYKPKDIVAGDFYWLEEDETHIYAAAADCTGHGVPGAMMSVLCSTALTRVVLEEKIKEPAEILNRTREIIIHKLKQHEDEIKDGMDICLVRINKVFRKNEIVFAGANRPLFVAEKNKGLSVYKGDKQPVGLYYALSDFTQQTIQLNENSIMYLFTDGYADQFGGEKNKKLGSKELTQTLGRVFELTLSEQKESLTKTFLQWKQNNEQTDDVTLIGLKI